MREKFKINEIQLLLAGFVIYCIVTLLALWDYGDKFEVWNERFFWVGIPIGLVFYYIQYRYNLSLLQKKEYVIFFGRLLVAFIILIIINAVAIHYLIPEEYLLRYFSGLAPKNLNKETSQGFKMGMVYGFSISYALNKAFYDIGISTMILFFHAKAVEPKIVDAKPTKEDSDKVKKIRFVSWQILAWFLWVLYNYLFSFNKIASNPSIVITESIMLAITIVFFYISVATSFKLLLKNRIFLALFWIVFLWFIVMILKQLLFGVLVVNLHLPAYLYGEDVMPEVKKALISMNKDKSGFFLMQSKKMMMFNLVGAQVLLKIPSKEIFILLCSIFYGYARKLIETQRRLLASQILTLKAQINPHFLFNSLNFLYAQSLLYSDELAKSTMLLSEIMRYGLKETNEEDKVSLENEVKHLENFIEFNQLRFSNRLYIDFQKEGNLRVRRIMPLLLITFVENAFKYGELMDENNPVKILLELKENQLYFKVFNKKRVGPKELSTGVGLENIKNRLELAYPKKYAIKISDEEHYYTAELKVIL